jgi:hypothetical protein
MPADLDPQTALVLTTALAVRVDWATRFDDDRTVVFAGTRTAALHRRTTTLDDVLLADTPAGPLTVCTVRGDGEVDVHLLVGEPQRGAGAVLAAGCAARYGPHRPGSDLAVGTTGPCLRVTEVRGSDPAPVLDLTTIAFTVEADHDLGSRPDVFGLADGGAFPRISPVALPTPQVRQSAVAEFSADGFRAAAVTAATAWMSLDDRPPGTERQRQVLVLVDRPFGLLAVHRPTGLVLTAGWVAGP